MAEQTAGDHTPRILAFTTDTISDPGVDFAGSAHLAYSPSVVVIPIPCSSGIRPEWVLHAIEEGFDGVFIAADGTDCSFVPDCTRRTGDLFARAQTLLSEHDHDPRRLKMAAVCSVCAESFVKHIGTFERDLAGLRTEGGD